MSRRVAVRAVIVHNSKLLCVKLKNYRHENQPDFWCTIGGGVDEGESLLKALEREVIEETGVKPNIGNLIYVQQFRFNGSEHLEFFFYVKNPPDYLNIDLSKTSHGSAEIETIEFIDPSKYILPEFLQTESLINLENKTVKLFNYL